MADVRNGAENGTIGGTKRREAGETSGRSSPIKRMKLEDDGPPVANPNTMEAVQEKNKAMALDILEKNRRISFLTQKCESLFRQRVVSDAAFRCIQRQWRTLLDDVSTASSVMEISEADLPDWHEIAAKSDSLGALRLPPHAVTVALPEWFVSISKADTDVELPTKKEGEDDEGDFKSTSVVLSEKEKRTESLLREEHEKLVSLVQKLLVKLSETGQDRSKHLELKTLVSQKREAADQVFQLQDELEAMKRKLSDMESDLEYKEAERHRACRDYDRLREYMEKQSKDGTTDASASQDIKTESGDGHQSETKPRVPEKKVTLVEAETKPSVDKEQLRRLQTDNNTLVVKLKEERQKTESMRTELTRLQALETAWKQEEVRQREEFEATVTRLRVENTQLTESLSAVRQQKIDEAQLIQDTWRSQLEKSNEDSARVKARVDELTTKNTALRDKLASFSTYRDQLSDLKSSHEAVKREAGRLKEQLEREKAKQVRTREAEDRKDALAQPSLSGDDLQANYAALKTEVERLRVDLETATVNQEAFKDENDALVAEIEVLNKEVEASRHSKKKVLKQLEEKRHAVRKLQTEVAKEADARAHSAEELATVRLQVSSLKYVHSQQKATLEAAKEAQKAKDLELEELKKYVKLLEMERDNVTTEKIKAQRDADVAKQMYKAEAAHKQRQVLQDKSRPCDQCESFRKKEADYEKRLTMLRVASSSSSSSDGAGLADLERFELQDLRKQLKCSVCQDRHKDVIISKCFHMFCKDCVDSNLKSRNRKCPTCKKMYGQDDVKSVWFT